MTYFEDLTPYTYHQSGIADCTLNIGWLDNQYQYNVGAVPIEFVEKLWEFLRIKLVHLRGLHYCNLCKPIGNKPHTVERNGTSLLIGSGEIRVFGKNEKIYAAPNLIYHYITEHNYKPPDEFIKAVIKSPTPESNEYRSMLKKHNLVNDFHDELYWGAKAGNGSARRSGGWHRQLVAGVAKQQEEQ